MSSIEPDHSSRIHSCNQGVIDKPESRLADREKAAMKENWFKSNRNLHDAWAERDRYREALEKFTDLACGDHESHDPHGWAKAALGEQRHLERRDEGEGA